MVANNRIKELRNKKGLSQKEFARAFSDFIKNDENVKPVSYATISRWEGGENEPKLETWIRLADFFNVSVSYLQGVSNDEPNKPKNIDLKKDPVVLSYGGKPVSKEDMDIIKAILEKHKGINHEKD